MNAKRWWVYQRERFPLVRHSLLTAAVVFGVTAVSLPQGSVWDAGVGCRAAAAFGIVLLLFLQLRIADEFKDAEDDRRCRPQRPVPRGLVSLSELRRIGLAAALAQAGMAAAATPLLLVPLAGLWSYLLLMTCEFFVGERLKRRPVMYLLSHSIILPLIYGFVSASVWLGTGRPSPAHLGWLMGLGLASGIGVELGRKIWSPADEIPGVDTYSGLWGIRRATAAWAAVLASAAACALRAAGSATAAPALVVPIAVVALGGFRGVIRFLRTAGSDGARHIERISGLWALATHVGLGMTRVLAG
jgi:4-hydroxybenzoate polyprenyltransferase